MKGLAKFNTEYDSSHEDAALQARGEFISRFPIQSLGTMALDDYVIGRRQRSFCYLVEAGTRKWANIQGANSFKFGVYFGKEKHDPTRKYRHSLKFGANVQQAFEAVKAALLELVRLGAEDQPDFAAIDANPLSQLFKAKILSLYYPRRFLAVCSPEHLEMLGDTLGFPEDLESSRYQHLLLEAKRRNAVTRAWSAPKFMAYLYTVYVRADRAIQTPIRKPRKKTPRRVDFEEVQRQRAMLGKKAEEYALEWERTRLKGAGLSKLIPKIADRREYPGYGYDFLSHSAPGIPRLIEVKCVAKMKDGLRFFLSENEHQTSISAEQADGYYFYLVMFDGHGKPVDILPTTAGQLYLHAELRAACYEVRFERGKV